MVVVVVVLRLGLVGVVLGCGFVASALARGRGWGVIGVERGVLLYSGQLMCFGELLGGW